MKKTKSFFFKIGLIMTPFVLLLDLIVLFLSYNIIYESTLKNFEAQIQNVSEIAVTYTENVNLSNKTTIENLNEDFNSLCELFDVTYLFCVDVDPDNNTETYIAIGFGAEASQEAKDTRFSGVVVNGSINEKELEAYNGNSDGVFSHEITRFGETLICYMPCTRWFNPLTASYFEYEKPLIVGTEITLTAIMQSFRQKFGMIAVLTVSITLIIVASFAIVLYFRVSRPVRKISGRMSSFVTDREKDKGFHKLEVKGNDEFAMMANSFNVMAEEIDRYIGDIEAMNRDKHMQEAEMDIARRIQKGLLRPEHTDNGKVSIDAYMLPAKDVGGDLYDYQLLDDGRVFVAIADVSGKGISASLFMSRAITLLHQFMLTEPSPAKILAEYNDTLAVQNPSGLFITTFLAVWDPTTGVLTYSNAGHNFPYILSDSLVILDGAHGVAAGLFEGEEYENYTVPFSAGDTLFLFTDGVNEAKNAGGGFYSTERLEEKLSGCITAGAAEVMADILRDLNSFTHGADQNDDITMLTLRIEQAPEERVLELSSELTQLTVIKEAIFALDVSDDMKMTVYLAAEEMFVNICSYAYDTPGKAEVRIARDDKGVSITLTDWGKPFDPTADLLDIEEYDHDHAIGGLGRFLTFSVADSYRYEYSDGKNILYLFFKEVKPDDNNENT